MNHTRLNPREIPFRILSKFLPAASALPAELTLGVRGRAEESRHCRGPLAAMLRLLQDYCEQFPQAELHFDHASGGLWIASIRCSCNEGDPCPFGPAGHNACPEATLRMIAAGN